MTVERRQILVPIDGWGCRLAEWPTHKPFAVKHVHLIRFADDGRAVEHSAVRDDLGMIMQLGLLPPPPSGSPDRPPQA
jgi:hypothetical protein